MLCEIDASHQGSYNQWQPTQPAVETTTLAAPYVAQYLADCFIPLDPDCDYGLPVTQIVSQPEFKLEGDELRPRPLPAIVNESGPVP